MLILDSPSELISWSSCLRSKMWFTRDSFSASSLSTRSWRDLYVPALILNLAYLSFSSLAKRTASLADSAAVVFADIYIIGINNNVYDKDTTQYHVT